MISVERDPCSSLWKIYYKLYDNGECIDYKERVVTSEYVVLGGGSLGSTKILLKSKERGLQISDKIGSRFTGNGDVLGFSYHGEEVVNCMGLDTGKYEFIIPNYSPGPTITSVIDLRSLPDMPYKDGMVVEDGSPPGASVKLVETMMLFASKTIGVRTFPLINKFEKFVEVSFYNLAISCNITIAIFL